MTNHINPLHVLLIQNDAKILDALRFNTSRRTGRTTAQCLMFIARAIENPYTWIRIEDHHNSTAASKMAFDMCGQMIEALKLDCMVRRSTGYYFYIAFGLPEKDPKNV